MDENEQVYYQIRGLIDSMPEEEKQKTKNAYNIICKAVEEAGEVGMVAVSLIGAELAAFGGFKK